MVKSSPVKNDEKLCNVSCINLSAKQSCCISKTNGCNNQPKRIKKRQELKMLYKKLREVIPSCQSKAVSSLDIVLHAVDYINELHRILEEEHPGAPKPFPVISPSSLSFEMLRNSPDNSRTKSFRDVTNVTTVTKPQPTARIRD